MSGAQRRVPQPAPGPAEMPDPHFSPRASPLGPSLHPTCSNVLSLPAASVVSRNEGWSPWARSGQTLDVSSAHTPWL